MFYLFIGGYFDNKFFETYSYPENVDLLIHESPHVLEKGDKKRNQLCTKKVTYKPFTLSDGHTVYVLNSEYDELKKDILLGVVKARYAALDRMLKKGKYPKNGSVP